MRSYHEQAQSFHKTMVERQAEEKAAKAELIKAKGIVQKKKTKCNEEEKTIAALVGKI